MQNRQMVAYSTLECSVILYSGKGWARSERDTEIPNGIWSKDVEEFTSKLPSIELALVLSGWGWIQDFVKCWSLMKERRQFWLIWGEKESKERWTESASVSSAKITKAYLEILLMLTGFSSTIIKIVQSAIGLLGGGWVYLLMSLPIKSFHIFEVCYSIDIFKSPTFKKRVGFFLEHKNIIQSISQRNFEIVTDIRIIAWFPDTSPGRV